MQLYDRLQKIVNDTFNGFTDRNNEIHLQLADLEKDVINHTKTCMTRKDKSAGNLIRTTNDANIINNASSQFFTLVNDMCHAVGLASDLPIIPSNSIKKKISKVATETIMPGIKSYTLSQQLDNRGRRAFANE